ncbi:hypothetical protein HRbin02_00805 [Candidatus Calditenuaceae archaeon HR02]|nr:hypothetical protein HRbin02_00805 [Candidatus Calditenuaceae archaeon HR02]
MTSELQPEDVEIDSAETRGRISTFTGSFLLGDKRYRFNGIAVMTIGGPTVGISLSNDTEAELISKGFSREQLEGILAEVQRRVTEGNFKVSGDIRFLEE